MIEKYISQETMGLLKWFVGAAIEIIGLASLFAFSRTTDYIHQYPMIFSLILIVGGYLLAISGRRK